MRGRLRERELDTDRESFEATVTRFSEFSWAERYPETVMELDCSLPVADVCVGYSHHGASVGALDALSSRADRGRSRHCLEQRSSDERGTRGKHGKTRRQNFCAFKKKDWPRRWGIGLKSDAENT